MVFESFQIKGKGRGRKIGIPTVNLEIPKNFRLQTGVYAARVSAEDKTYKGALHFGPVPVFNDAAESLEVYLLDIETDFLPDLFEKKIRVEIVKKIRNIKNFPTPKAMVERIQRDIEEVKKALKTPAGAGV